ncbi:DUF222 domain-containing protein [Egibacter rhizosphaerae]|uniref:DUF222 domain-containing protein n=1 Tax=Egibacter rhizosphaerae TaxID=1670831 RepID=A0A411YHX7_9ACTN|nr:DUF222 domain-containing protein [Egibacter rhizosphaerae]QBI20719.1 DUF222 domain-containing protein [Egibacter rhizosphaerae]
MSPSARAAAAATGGRGVVTADARGGSTGESPPEGHAADAPPEGSRWGGEGPRGDGRRSGDGTDAGPHAERQGSGDFSTGEATHAALELIDQGLDALTSSSFDELDDPELGDLIRRARATRDRIDAVTAEAVTLQRRRTSWRRDGARSQKEWLSEHLGLSRGQASGVLREAEGLAKLPRTRAALARGRLSAGHALVATRAVRDLPAEDHDELDRMVVGEAAAPEPAVGDGTESPADEAPGGADDGDGVADGSGEGEPGDQGSDADDHSGDADDNSGATRRHHGASGNGSPRPPLDPEELRSRLDDYTHAKRGDAMAERERRAWEARRVNASRTADGAPTLDNRLDFVGGETVITAINALAAPKGDDDERTPEQRKADALVELAERALQYDQLPEAGGQRPQVTVVVPLSTLLGEEHAPAAHLDHLGSLSSATARQIACDAEITRVITGPNSAPLDVGRSSRSATRPQRRALAVRDGGCVGCHAPASWCEAHHLRHWADRGSTDLANLCLLCRLCHTHVHQGTRVLVGNATEGFRLEHPSPEATRRRAGSPPDPEGTGRHRKARDPGQAPSGPHGTGHRTSDAGVGRRGAEAGHDATSDSDGPDAEGARNAGRGAGDSEEDRRAAPKVGDPEPEDRASRGESDPGPEDEAARQPRRVSTASESPPTYDRGPTFDSASTYDPGPARDPELGANPRRRAGFEPVVNPPRRAGLKPEADPPSGAASHVRSGNEPSPEDSWRVTPSWTRWASRTQWASVRSHRGRRPPRPGRPAPSSRPG